jgi:hypothetical protein
MAYDPIFQDVDKEGYYTRRTHVFERIITRGCDGVDELKTALDRGWDPNIVFESQRNHGRTPLLLAIIQERVDLVELLMERKADVNHVHNNDALHWATRTTRLDMVRSLVEHKANINAKDCANWTPLMIASASAMDDIVTFLLSHGADKSVVASATPRGFESYVVATGMTALDLARARPFRSLCHLTRYKRIEELLDTSPAPVAPDPPFPSSVVVVRVKKPNWILWFFFCPLLMVALVPWRRFF